MGSLIPKLRKLMISLRASFWFIPSGIVVAALILALILIEVDSHSAYELTNEWPRLFGAGAEGSRGMLSTIAGSIMTMMGLTFSMTLVTLSLASSQYTSRILRNFIRNRATQTVLGLFAGIFTYCLVVLRTIRGGDINFIPSVSIFVGFVLALIGVAVIVYFIHHIASSIQASNIISDVAEETISSMRSLFPPREDSEAAEGEPESVEKTEGLVTSNKSGYIQTIDEEFLCGLSKKLKSAIFIDYRIGDFVVNGTPLVRLRAKMELDSDEVKAIGEAFSIQRYRTIEQDPLFGIRQIVDIALKALSPGINDTTTALVCIDYLTSVLAFLLHRTIPSTKSMREGELRLVVKRASYRDFFFNSFSQIIKAGNGSLVIQERILCAVETLSTMTESKERTAELFSVVELVAEVVSDSFTLASEIELLETRIKIFQRKKA